MKTKTQPIQPSLAITIGLAIGLGVGFILGIVVGCSVQRQPAGPHAPASGVLIAPSPSSPPTAQTSPTATETPLPEDNPPPEPTPTPLPAISGVREPYRGIWISAAELAALPTTGPAWDHLVQAADRDPGIPDISDQNQMHDVYMLAKALVYARTGKSAYRDEVVNGIMKAIGTEKGGKTLALGRNLVSYVIAADLINLPADPEVDQVFRAWLQDLLTERLEGRTLQSTHEDRPNNWGTHAGASRAAIAVYLGDTDELKRTAQVFKGWLGDRNAYAGFKFGNDLSWHADPRNPISIQPVGAKKDGHVIDGALPDDMRRGGQFQWPPAETGYPWEALQGAVVQAEILHRAGYPAWDWEDRALLRAVQFLYNIGWEATGDDQWQPWLINYAYGTTFAAHTPARPGKNMGWTDWTHSAHRPTAIPTPAPTPETNDSEK